MSKCRLEDVPSEAVEEYAKALWQSAKDTGHIFASRTWGEVADGAKIACRAEARQAIADGAEPEGWEWACVGYETFTWDSKPKWGLVRKMVVSFAQPPKPTTRELLDKAVAARAKYSGMYQGGYPAEYGVMGAALDALLSRLVSEIEELRK